MQYPIIDLMTDAYQRNGWTGLEVIDGTNIANPIYGRSTPYTSNGVTYTRNNNMITAVGTVINGLSYFNITFKSDASTAMPATKYRGKYVRVFTDFPYGKYLNFFREDGTFFAINNNTVIPNDAFGFRFYFSINTGVSVNDTYNYMIVVSDEPIPDDIPYEPYAPPTTDIEHRLKLPLLHYFPHPVIDALHRAAAGTQTVDDTEILQHYLTPLGIGGI